MASDTDDRVNAWFATCPKGVESLLLSELESLGAETTRETVAGVHFSGPRAVMYRACLWSRLANRILWPLARADAADGDQVDVPSVAEHGASLRSRFRQS